MNSIKQSIASAAMPFAQGIVRNAPPSRLRERIWRWGKWRSKDFVIEANGVLIAGNTLDLIQGYLYWFGMWEPNLTQFIVRRMKESPDRTFVDVGANIGYFSALVAKHYPRAKVVSIEAFPPIIAKLHANLRLNELANVRVIAAAASDSPGTLELFYAGSTNEAATTSVPGKLKVKPNAVSVPCNPLAEILSDNEIATVRFIKIDVEGAEPRVIKGLIPKLGLLPRDAEVVVEISGDSSESSEFIFDTFVSRGFHAYELDNNYDPLSYLYPRTPTAPRRLRAIPTTQTDVVFSPVDAELL